MKMAKKRTTTQVTGERLRKDMERDCGAVLDFAERVFRRNLGESEAGLQRIERARQSEAKFAEFQRGQA